MGKGEGHKLYVLKGEAGGGGGGGGGHLYPTRCGLYRRVGNELNGMRDGGGGGGGGDGGGGRRPLSLRVKPGMIIH